jgi:hypothetical protein
MARVGRRRSLWSLPTLATLAIACATAKSPAIVPPPPVPAAAPPSQRLAWMPFERRAAPEVASVVNQRLARVIPDGVTESYQAPVSMEMAQLALECIERTPKCYGAVGRSVGADKLLWAELVHGTRRDPRVTLRVSLCDVGSGAILQQAARTFSSEKAAHDGAVALIDGTFGSGRTGPAGARAAP